MLDAANFYLGTAIVARDSIAGVQGIADNRYIGSRSAGAGRSTAEAFPRPSQAAPFMARAASGARAPRRVNQGLSEVVSCSFTGDPS